jgi:hypothetical protein
MITNTLAERFGWSRKRLARARAKLIDMDEIRRLRAARQNGPAFYQWSRPY